jgi:hypothetical protein
MKDILDNLIRTKWRIYQTDTECFYDFGGEDSIPHGIPMLDVVAYFQLQFPGCLIQWCDSYFVDLHHSMSGILVRYPSSKQRTKQCSNNIRDCYSCTC